MVIENLVKIPIYKLIRIRIRMYSSNFVKKSPGDMTIIMLRIAIKPRIIKIVIRVIDDAIDKAGRKRQNGKIDIIVPK